MQTKKVGSLVEQPPELTKKDEKILDKIWDEIAERIKRERTLKQKQDKNK